MSDDFLKTEWVSVMKKKTEMATLFQQTKKIL